MCVADFPKVSRSHSMKTSLVAFVLALSAIAVGQTTAPQSQAQPAGSQPAATQQPGTAPAAGQPGAPPQKKEIKDPAEYNAYVSAVQQKDPAAQISGFEAFLTQYPNSVVKEDALEALMGAYQKANNAAKMADAANRLLAVNPDNVRALALLALTERSAQKWSDAYQHATRGLQAIAKWQKPDGVSDADFQKQKTQLTAALNSIAGFSALQLKDYANAQKYLRASVEANPNNLEDVYPLAFAYLSANPPDSVNGIFFIARAADLAPAGQAQTQITNYGKSVYTKYHGSDQGWTDLLATAKTTPLPHAGFTISQYVPPTPTPKQQGDDFTFKVLQSESVPYVVQTSGGVSTNCQISGSTSTTMSAYTAGNTTFGSATSSPDLRMNCNSSQDSLKWQHVLNAMLVEASDGNAYVIACDRAWRWSKCSGLKPGDIFNARR